MPGRSLWRASVSRISVVLITVALVTFAVNSVSKSHAAVLVSSTDRILETSTPESAQAYSISSPRPPRRFKPLTAFSLVMAWMALGGTVSRRVKFGCRAIGRSLEWQR
jgi:hypothetical protein